MNEKSKTKSGKNSSGAKDAAVVASMAVVDAAESASAEPAAETPAAKEPLVARIKVVTSKKVVGSFASLRVAQATFVSKAHTWLNAFDAAATKSLTASETFLVSKLGTPAS